MEIKNKRSEAEELNLAISLLRACLPNIEYLSGAYPLSVTHELEADMKWFLKRHQSLESVLPFPKHTTSK